MPHNLYNPKVVLGLLLSQYYREQHHPRMSSKTAAPKVILPSVLQVAQVGQDFGEMPILVAVMEAPKAS